MGYIEARRGPIVRVGPIRLVMSDNIAVSICFACIIGDFISLCFNAMSRQAAHANVTICCLFYLLEVVVLDLLFAWLLLVVLSL